MIKGTKASRGVTLTELLVVLLIIAILGTIAVPVFLNRIETARVRTAQAETRELAQAMDACAAIHGFYVPLYMLDDVPEIEGQSSEADSIELYDSFTPFVVKVSVPLTSQIADQPDLTDRDDPDVDKMVDQWQGPFINFNRFWMGSDGDSLKTSVLDSERDEIKMDLPLDPWGQPYRVFSPRGITGSSPDLTDPVDLTTSVTSLASEFDFRLPSVTTEGSRSRENPYDRWTIVSLGPDQVAGIPGSPTDDLTYFFGFVATETSFVN